MTGDLAALFGLSQQFLWHGFAVFLRVGAIVALLPAFGEESVPMRIKLVLAVSFTAIVAPAAPTPPAEPEALQVTWLILSETVIGLLIGIGIRMFVLALQMAGSIAAQATSLSQILGSAGAEPMPAIGHILVISGLALAVTLGLHVRAAQLMIWSYQTFPMGVLPQPADVSKWGIQQISGAFSLSFALAAPFVIISFLYNLTLGVINRAMPQLMVAFVGAPVITAGGLTLLFALSPLMLSHWHEAFAVFLARPFGGPP
ncbi:flagellar biosynthetic protein FliR [Rhodalgimonas zhirmunskyi]|uniref:Flagellar biosynthetic protein FliR n=1 Tax=Rhodalgimonas zhirmunskyi TaxID=2964767 RepID=A0AAJ1X6Y8_9RHOB|nr:flagellar biosynthetic protein FliR [Rhodoalgimonas zhirmunskyi]MDQ2093982.1 flagellar biosynthetic protein FliR [Rhodoalgimonas zhirmunskyi]